MTCVVFECYKNKESTK